MSPYQLRESTWSRGNVRGAKVDVIDKSQVVVGEPRCRNEGTGLRQKPALLWGRMPGNANPL